VDLFEAPHNQTSSGTTCCARPAIGKERSGGKPDWADRPEGEKPSEWPNRKLWEPGTHYKYNDARVNVLALAALNVWRRSAAGCAAGRNHGAHRSVVDLALVWLRQFMVEIDGRKIQSVTGGGHWGGGMFNQRV